MKNKIVNPEMTESFNVKSKRDSKITDAQKVETKSRYLHEMGIDENRRDSDYDTKLVNCDDHGSIIDNNNLNQSIKATGIMWGIIIVAAIIIYALASIFGSSMILTVIILAGALGVLIATAYSLFSAFSILISKRDIGYKLYSLLHIAPLLIVCLAISMIWGFEGLFALISITIFCAIMGIVLYIILKILRIF